MSIMSGIKSLIQRIRPTQSTSWDTLGNVLLQEYMADQLIPPSARQEMLVMTSTSADLDTKSRPQPRGISSSTLLNSSVQTEQSSSLLLEIERNHTAILNLLSGDTYLVEGSWKYLNITTTVTVIDSYAD